MTNGRALGRDHNGGGRGRGRSRGRGRGRGRGHGDRGKKNLVELSADNLNKELDNYHAEAMQT